MAPRSALVNLSYTALSDSEDEMAAFPTPDSNTENKAPARNARGKAAQAAKSAPVKKAAAKKPAVARRTSGGNVRGVKKQNATTIKKEGAKSGRKVLAERQNANMSDTEEVDEFEGEEEAVAAPVEEVKPSKRGRPAKSKVVQDDSVAEIPAPVKKTRKTAPKEPAAKAVSKAKTSTKPKASKRAQSPEPEPEVFTIPETQPDPDDMDIDDVEESIEMDEIAESMPPPPSRPSGRRAQPQVRSGSAQRQPTGGLRRAGSVSDTERDPVLRRKIGEVTKKLEAMTTKYDNLKEIATSSKESNFDQLRRKTEQAAKDQDAVIKALKSQMAEMQSRSSEFATMRKEMAKLQKEHDKVVAENKTLASSLASAQNENKSLTSKLAASRSSAPQESKNVPGSAVKQRSVVLPGTAEAAKEAQLTRQKLDLYSDLTGLVILGVKKNDEGEDVYDCLQTGRNGTLHFHLLIGNDPDMTYDEQDLVYDPLLDGERDRDLLDLLPEYLTEEISFPRSHASKFYMKVQDSMSKKIVLED
ncbi:hypothetical protein P154DRAFT_555129 [Amniculicola lignicola CBS 123094]|uniref:Monopolin complex subunit Csm1/Pcs1 C-terminal domain-containing protein n=1 Tax=Amniculicola lignicola CBS 123094 TaxID=1392246 RepID=A0A6A5WBF3_9PLEO|nr:hypothetical protein P154DRAFT_555129 [Amniculicola lignicola CBS 123094]